MEINIHIAQLTLDNEAASLTGDRLRQSLELQTATELTSLIKSGRINLPTSPSQQLERVTPGPEPPGGSTRNPQNLGQQLVHTILGGLNR